MAKYSTNNGLAGTKQAITTTYKTLLGMASSATLRRGKLYDLTVGNEGTPADNAMAYDVSRQTAAGTSTSVTPNLLDPADGAAVSTCVANSTVEPTITANSSLLQIPGNQRATYRWVAAPGSEFVWPATSAAGLVVRALSPAYTGTADASVLFEEQ